ncbi:MAG: HEAT repeat domain-containing protein [Nitrospirota bacterium]|nr:HEAT repeat domain-containing protein [Nitrospirota bacterium]
MKIFTLATLTVLLLAFTTALPAALAADRESVVTDLKNPEWDIRWNAIQELNRHPDASTTDALIESCGDPLADIRDKAADTLAAIGKPALPKLLKALNNQRDDVVICACVSLGRIKDPAAIDPLIRTLQHRAARVRESALEALGALQSSRASDSIVPLLKDPDEQVREKALLVMGDLRDPRVIDGLILGLKSRNDKVTSASYRALVAIGPSAVPKLVKQIEGNDWSLKYKVIEILAAMKSPEAIAGLVRLVGSDQQQLRETAGYKLQQIGEQVVDPLIACLRSPDPRTRQAAATILGNMKAAKAETPLLKLLKDNDPTVRGAAASALGSFKNMRILEACLPLLQDRDESVRASVLEGLNKMAYPWLVEEFISATTDRSAKVRLKAVTILKELHDLRIVRTFQRTLKDPDPEVRERSLWGLYSRASREQESEAGASLINDPSQKVRLAAVGVLARNLHSAVGMKAGLTALGDGDPEVRKAVAKSFIYSFSKDERIAKPFLDALVKERDPEMLSFLVEFVNIYDSRDARAVEPILTLLQSEKEHVRAAAARALGTLRDKRAIGPLAALLKDPDIYVQDRAVAALRKIYPHFPEAQFAPIIENRFRALKHSEAGVRRVAAYDFGLMEEQSAVPALIDAIGDRDHEVSEKAISALGEIGDRRAIKPLLAIMQKHPSGRTGDETWRFQGSAARALKRLKDPASIGPLIKIMKDPRTNQGHEAGDILAEIGDPAVAPLIDELRDRSSPARILAAFALAKTHDPRAGEPLAEAFREKGDTIFQQIFIEMGSPAVTALIGLTKDGLPNIRAQAVTILGRIGDPRAVDALIAATADADTRVRFAAASALGSLRSAAAVKPLTGMLADPAHGHEAGKALKMIGEPAVEPLIAIMRSADPIARRNAVALPENVSNRAFAPVLLLGLGDKDRDVRVTTLRALSDYGRSVADMEIPGNRFVPLLGDLDAEVRKTSAVILGYYKSRTFIKPLCGVLLDQDQSVRSAALGSLGAIGHPDADRCIERRTP